MGTVTRKVPGQAVGFDPFRTIQKIHWANAQFIIVIKFVGAGGATNDTSNIPSGFWDFSTGFGPWPEMQEPAESDNAKQFFKDHSFYDAGDFSGENTAKIIPNGNTFWYFGAITGQAEGWTVNVDTAGCFPVGAGSVQASMKLFKTPPPDSQLVGTEESYYTFHDLMTAAPDFANQPAITIVSSNRWNNFVIEFKDDDGNTLNPPLITWHI